MQPACYAKEHGVKRPATTRVVRGVECGMNLADDGMYRRISNLQMLMAESEGFEPPNRLPRYLISSQAPSTTRPALRGARNYSARHRLDFGRDRRPGQETSKKTEAARASVHCFVRYMSA